MTNNQEKAKEYLEKIRKVEESISKKRIEIMALEYSALPGGIRYDKDKVQTSPTNYTEIVLIDAADMKTEIEEDIARLDDMKSNAYNIIRKIEDQLCRAVLEWYYINCRDMEYTSQQMYVSERNAYYIRDDALEAFGSLM